MLAIAATARVSPLADIEDSVRGTRIEIGAESVVDAFVKIKPAGGRGDLVVGERVYINSGCVIYTGAGITIGDDVLIAANCTLAPVNHLFMRRDMTIREQRFGEDRGGIVIEPDVWIGANSVILDGARLRRGCVVGAGSVVMGELEEYSVNVGAPTRVTGYRT